MAATDTPPVTLRINVRKAHRKPQVGTYACAKGDTGDLTTPGK